MPIIHDEEFGDITIRRSAQATQVRLRVAPDGKLRASLPVYAPLFLLKRLIKTSRPELRKLLSQSLPGTVYHDGQQIGKSHTLIAQQGAQLSAVVKKLRIVVTLPPHLGIDSLEASHEIRRAVIQALRIEARSYLPKRLQYLAQQMGFSFERVRFSHASSRWGSCSSTGTISLNIALMKLPFELIDYVIIHELSHTKELNHSEAFWSLVAAGDPGYKLHRKLLKSETPSI